VRARAVLIATVILVASCQDAPTAPQPIAPVPGAAASADVGDAPQTIGINVGLVNEYDGGAGSAVSGAIYPHPTVVRATLSGGTVTYTPNYTGIGGPQGPFGPLGRTALEWHDGTSLHIERFFTNIKYILFFGDGAVLSASRDPMDYLVLAGFRPPGTNTFIFCGPIFLNPCFTYGGDGGTIVLSRLPAELSVTPEFTEVDEGATPYIDYRSVPLVVEGQQIPFVVDSTFWYPDKAKVGGPQDDSISAAGRGACASDVPDAALACRHRMLSSGTFIMKAWVNGIRKTGSAHITMKGRTIHIVPKASSIEPTVSRYTYDSITGKYPLTSIDTSQETITVSVTDGNGAKVPNAIVNLSLIAREGMAGHEHIGGKPTGSLSETEVHTGENGEAKVVFIVPEASGPVSIHGTSDGAKEDSAVVTVELKGLQRYPAGPDDEYTGMIEKMHTDNHWIAPGYTTKLKAFAKAVHDIVGEPLGINDISLQFGGLFDVDTVKHWDVPHRTHRQGTGADIRTRYKSAGQWPDSLGRRVLQEWKKLNLGNPVVEDNHVHLNFLKKAKP
jgi:hypothetical protein